MLFFSRQDYLQQALGQYQSYFHALFAIYWTYLVVVVTYV